MNNIVSLKQGDTHNALQGTVYQKDGMTPLDISGCTVLLSLQNCTDAIVQKEACTFVTDGKDGRWTYAFKAGQTDIPGTYDGELEITYVSDSTVCHAPTQGFFVINILRDLG